MAPVTPTPAPVKVKTKAKSRYLKAKKDRKKKRKAGASKPPPDLQTRHDNGATSDGTSDEQDVDANLNVSTVEERPPKRPKTVLNHEEAAETERTPRKSPMPQATLPSFPLPIPPNAPAKSTLALQGLDKAFLDAHIVDPLCLVPVDTLGHDRTEAGELPVLSEKIKKRLGELGITDFFAVQTALLPFLLPPQSHGRALYCPYDPPRDVCVSAPTGSGKTLAYVIPIVEMLSARIVTRLRALIVLPTRDLVVQVHETFEALCKGRGLKIGIATGQHSFVHEQSQLIAEPNHQLEGGSSKVDILICTPGRLMDHLAGTKNFTLQHLRFLVIDEADRLLTQSFQDWLAQVLTAIRTPPRNSGQASVQSESHDVQVPLHDALAPSWLHASLAVQALRTDLDDAKASSCQKLLFSATLTRDPSRIAAIGLRDAQYFVVQGSASHTGTDHVPAMLTESFAIPTTLKEHMIVCTTAQKPLVLFHLMDAHQVTNALVFTKSAESTTRLVCLFEFFEQVRAASQKNDEVHRTTIVRMYSSDLSRGERKAILERFKEREIDILVCSDLISRGIDISHVSHVVSYDAPVDMRKYVHRIGRTARAGRNGDAWTLVEEQEARHFKQLLSSAHHLEHVKKMRVSDKDVEYLIPHYEVALRRLKDVYTRSYG